MKPETVSMASVDMMVVDMVLWSRELRFASLCWHPEEG